MGGDALLSFAVWNPGRNLAIAIDISSGEVEPCEQSLRSARRAWGDHYAGPFPSWWREPLRLEAGGRPRGAGTQSRNGEQIGER
jgi:hypothetical protein